MNGPDQTLGGALAAVAAANPARPALVEAQSGSTLTYSAFMNRIAEAARGFLKMGIRAGDKVGMLAPNRPEWLQAFFGLARIGAVPVPIDPGAAEEAVAYILRQSESRMLVAAIEAGAERIERLKRLPGGNDAGLEKILVIGDGQAGSAPDFMDDWTRVLAEGRSIDEAALQTAAAAVHPRDAAAIMYTSGTTGAPKGVVLDHASLIHKSLHATDRQGIGSADRLCLFFPLFHMFGNTCIALAGLLRAACLVMAGRRFEPAAVLEAVSAYRCTAVYGSPSMLIALLDHPRFRRQDWAEVKKGIVGGAPCPMELMRRIVEEVGVAGITVAWGITEAASWVTMTRPLDPIELRVSTIGTALPCCEVKIVDPATGESLSAGRQGELCTRGYIMTGYYNLPEATSAAVDREGWLHTGDLGEMDPQGYVKITGRLKDVIERSGVRIYPVVVEEVLYRLPQVSEVQVFGFPHPESGMEAAAWIKLKSGEEISLAAVAAHVAERLPVELRPRYYKFVSSFPMTASGKIQKFKLAELAAAEVLETP